MLPPTIFPVPGLSGSGVGVASAVRGASAGERERHAARAMGRKTENHCMSRVSLRRSCGRTIVPSGHSRWGAWNALMLGRNATLVVGAVLRGDASRDE